MAKKKLRGETVESFRKEGYKGGKKSGAARGAKITREEPSGSTRPAVAKRQGASGKPKRNEGSAKVHGDKLNP